MTRLGINLCLARMDGCRSLTELDRMWSDDMGETAKAIPEVRQAYARRRAELGRR